MLKVTEEWSCHQEREGRLKNCSFEEGREDWDFSFGRYVLCLGCSLNI